jgi:hypothetical protein
MKSWLPIAEDSDFSIYNIPFGIFKTKSSTPRAASILGDQVIDLYALAQGGYLKDVLADAEVLNQKTLNAFIALGKPITNAVRLKIQTLFSEENAAQKDSLSAYLLPVVEVKCLCLFTFRTTPIFIAVASMPPMWVRCSAIRIMHYCRIGCICRWVITDELHPLW